MHIPMPLGKGELMRITTGSFMEIIFIKRFQ
ncbi:Uncharacterised protein [Streptococcus pneumoniae]|nr:Uncharacterised protein [Streptococcus pneumoniae]VLK42444.1 Uncharacterised protein [Streptococcus pneumoniae]